MPLSPEAFVAELDGENRAALDRIAAASCAGEPGPELTVQKLLVLALENELEATECAAAWIPTTRKVGVKLALARQAGDEATARLYEETIQADEKHHHELGRRLLLELATTDEAQTAAREASRRVLSMAEELQEIARLEMGISGAPDC